MENASCAVLPLQRSDLVMSWPSTATASEKGAWTKALNAAFRSGLTISMKAERLHGFSVPLVLDLEVINLAQSLAKQAGHCNLYSFILTHNSIVFQTILIVNFL